MALPEPPLQHDTLPGIAAPVLTRQLFGHDAQLNSLAASYRAGRLHHAYLFQGPRGIGKSTAAFQLAQHLLAFPRAADAPDTLQLLDHDGIEYRQLANSTHLQVLHLTRPFDPKSEKFKTLLTVEEVRRIGHFLSHTNAGAGYRVIIIDPADDLNAAAGNALLKNLEEPPARTVFILTANDAGRVLPTIRSRCQFLRFDALSPRDMAAALRLAKLGVDQVDGQLLAFAQGSVRRAITFAVFGGLEVTSSANMLISSSRFDAAEAAKLADAVSNRDASLQYSLLTDHLLERISTVAAGLSRSRNTEGALQMSKFYNQSASMLNEAERFNLDRKQVVIGLLSALQSKFSSWPI